MFGYEDGGLNDYDMMKKKLDDLQLLDAQFKKREIEFRLKQAEFAVRISLVMHQSICTGIFASSDGRHEPFVLTC